MISGLGARVSRGRLEQLRAAAADGGLPAIVVFEVGGAYFVEDGHHRVALALEQGADFIDAQVTSLLTEYEIGPDVDVCQLIHTEQQRWLLEETGLALARPKAVIQFTLLDGYTQLRDIIDAYGYRLCRQRGELLPLSEVAGESGTTPSISQGWRRSAARICRSSTPPGTRPMATCSCGSISSAEICAPMTTTSTSTPPPGTRAGSISAISASGTICATAGRHSLGAARKSDRRLTTR